MPSIEVSRSNFKKNHVFVTEKQLDLSIVGLSAGQGLVPVDFDLAEMNNRIEAGIRDGSISVSTWEETDSEVDFRTTQKAPEFTLFDALRADREGSQMKEFITRHMEKPMEERKFNLSPIEGEYVCVSLFSAISTLRTRIIAIYHSVDEFMLGTMPFTVVPVIMSKTETPSLNHFRLFSRTGGIGFIEVSHTQLDRQFRKEFYSALRKQHMSHFKDASPEQIITAENGIKSAMFNSIKGKSVITALITNKYSDLMEAADTLSEIHNYSDTNANAAIDSYIKYCARHGLTIMTGHEELSEEIVEEVIKEEDALVELMNKQVISQIEESRKPDEDQEDKLAPAKTE